MKEFKNILQNNKEKIIVNSTIGLIVALPTVVVTFITSNEKDLSLFKAFFDFKMPLWVGLIFIFFIVWFFNFMYKKEERRKSDKWLNDMKDLADKMKDLDEDDDIIRYKK